MRRDVTIILAEDDDGHAALIQKNLKRAGLLNPIIRFSDVPETLAFFFDEQGEIILPSDVSYIVLLDIRMPGGSGVDILARIKQHESLASIPVIMLTTTDDPREIANCHRLGCNSYITKPVDYLKFVETIRNFGLYLMVVEVP